jgi:hypothetical protein
MQNPCCILYLIILFNFIVFVGPDGGEEYRCAVSKRISPLIDPRNYKDTSTDTSMDTVVYPLVQMQPFNVLVDSRVTENFFRSLPLGSSIRLASGYFNLTEHHRQTLIGSSAADYEILTAAPEVDQLSNCYSFNFK